MKSRRTNSLRSMFVILAIVAAITVGIILLASRTPAPAENGVTLEEGKNYDIQPAGQGKYEIIDEQGNRIELERIDSETFQDSTGKKYRFVSGSPFKFMGTE